MEQTKTFLSLEDLAKMSEQGYQKIIKENKIKDLLRSIGLFNDQNIKNTILIMEQRPDATFVRRMDDWNFYKRSVNKDEKSIKVISHYISKSEKDYTDEYGNTYTKAEEKLNMKVGYLFDISQTNGKPYPYLNTNKETICKQFDNAKQSLERTASGFEVTYKDLEGVESTTDFENKKIVINNGMTLDKTLEALIKEVVNVLVETRSRSGFTGIITEQMTGIKAIEANCSNYAICSKLGLDIPDLELDDISKFSQEQISAFKDNLNMVRSITHQVVSNFENAIEKGIRDLDKKMKEQEQAQTEQSEETKQIEQAPEEKKTAVKSKSKKSEVQQC